MRTAMNPRRSLCLMHADERAIPFPTLKAFAGSRHAAIQRRDWNDIHIDAGILRAPEKKSSRSNSAYSAPAVREPGACGHPPPSGMVFPDVDDGEHRVRWWQEFHCRHCVALQCRSSGNTGTNSGTASVRKFIHSNQCL
jgi:hypothetical protein